MDLVKLLLNADYVKKAKTELETLPFTVVRHKEPEMGRGQKRKRRRRTTLLKRKQSRRVFSLGHQTSSNEDEDEDEDSSGSDGEQDAFIERLIVDPSSGLFRIEFCFCNM